MISHDTPNRTTEDGARLLGVRLREARKSVSLTQAAVAQHLEMARTTVVAIEKGERAVLPAELMHLAALYRRSVNELLRPGAPPLAFAVQLRATVANNAVLAKDIAGPTTEFQRLCEDYHELERLCGSPLAKNYPPVRSLPSTSPEVAGDDLARRERLRLGLGDGPIANLRLLLEQDVGLRVFFLPFPSDVAAMFSYDAQLGGCIAVNSKHPYERRRQSLAHEYAHFLSSRFHAEVALVGKYQRNPESERIAISFARSFLMPADGVARRVNEVKSGKAGRLTYADICTFAYYYGVSVESFTKRLEDLRLVPGGSWEKLRASGFKISEARELLGISGPPTVDDDLPPRYRFLALAGYRDALLTESQLAQFLRVDRMSVRQIVAESSAPTDLPSDAASEHSRDGHALDG